MYVARPEPGTMSTIASPLDRGSRIALEGFRSDLYSCFPARADVLFELVDGLCSPVHVDSLAHVTLAAAVRRGHGAAYAALAHGRVDAERLRDVLAAQRPHDWRPDFAVDTTTWARSAAKCSPDRAFYYHPSRHTGGQPVVAGWCYQWLAALSPARDSWVAPIDAQRLLPGENPHTVAIRQIEDLVSRLGPTTAEPLFVFDAGYDLVRLTHGLRGENAQVAVRIRNDRRFYTRVVRSARGYEVTRGGTSRGRPPLHGPRFRCAAPDTWHAPDYTYACHHRSYGLIQAQAWSRLHPRQSRYYNHDGTMRIIEGTVIRVEVERMPGDRECRTNTLWLWWSGPIGAQPDLDRIVNAYLHRYDVEHAFRFVKQVLGWTTPRLRSPEQADRWTWLILAALTQLRLARQHVADHRLPWQAPQHTPALTPGRVRTGFGHLLPTLASPAKHPKPSKPGPGRPKGSRSAPAPRFPVHKLPGANRSNRGKGG